MTRQEKYPETPTFHYHQANPHNRINGDCVIRAVSVFLGITWTECLKEMTECGLKKGLILNDKANIELYLASKGIRKMPMPRRADRTRYTAGEFCKELASHDKRYLLSLAHHETVVVNQKVWDIWNCTGKSVGNYWISK
jgi:hypothetical protein